MIIDVIETLPLKFKLKGNNDDGDNGFDDQIYLA